jgi:hypothetical protein
MNHSYFDNSLAVGLHPLSCKHFMHNPKKKEKRKKKDFTWLIGVSHQSHSPTNINNINTQELIFKNIS